MVVEALMVALKVVVRDELGDGEAEVSFPEQHEPVEALRLDRQDEPFGESVQVRAVGWQLQAFHASPSKKLSELVGEQRIAIVDEVALALEEPIDVVGEVASDLLIQAP